MHVDLPHRVRLYSSINDYWTPDRCVVNGYRLTLGGSVNLSSGRLVMRTCSNNESEGLAKALEAFRHERADDYFGIHDTWVTRPRDMELILAGLREMIW